MCCKLVNVILVALLCATNIVFAQNPIVLGNKRITVITPTLIRLEYAQNQKFLDHPTLFARERGNVLENGVIVIALDGGSYKKQILERAYRLEICGFGQERRYINIPSRSIRKKTSINFTL